MICQVVGAGGAELWRFLAIRAGRQELQFQYRRPFEKRTEPKREVSIAVTVKLK